ncbi:hypothetical protein MAE02_54830 [Microvirga aerophila]|uniref:Uncharacterized protein n=2 Tax=Microvirga aerophila TaxID=670291 RepID=A0A512C172_9HYPH|nr:hypothetical protein MAE02_54830 [Microvirga aerophila]
MQGYSYIGMTEAALYSNWSMKPGSKDKTVLWHVHLFVWRTNRASLKALVDEINNNHESLIPTLCPADYRQIPCDHFIGKVLYLLKSPQEYRVWSSKDEVVDPETGEIMLQLNGRYRQKSRALRPVDQVRAFRFLRNRYLDHLMLAGGEGKALLTAIRWKALEPLRFHQCYGPFVRRSSGGKAIRK